MKAVIMAGGFGTRLRPVTCNIPKPMVPVANKPLMEHIIERLREANITDILAILYFQPEKITDYFGDGKKFGVNISYVTAAADYGTAGSVKNAQDFLDERFIVISGDVLTDFKIWEAIDFHDKKGAQATIMLTRVENPLAFGIVITDEDGRIVRFLEKPSWGQVFSDTINTGIYILDPEVLDLIPEKTEFDFSKNLFPKMLENALPLYGYIAKGYWKDVGNLREYRKVNMDVIRGVVRVNIDEKKYDTIGFDLWIGNNSKVSENIKISGGVLIGDNCIIKEGVELRDVVIGPNTVIEEGTRIYNSVIWNNNAIKDGVIIKKGIICDHSFVGSRAHVEEEAIISDNCNVGEGATVREGIKMWPGKVLEDGAVLSSSLIWGEKWNRQLFGAEGITGIANVEITPEFAAKLGASLGALIGAGNIVSTSRDPHRASRVVNRAIISGLLSVGVNVYDLRVIPECVARYQVSETSRVAGIHTRKSPFSQQHIDIKFIDEDGMNFPISKQKTIERLFFREDFPRANIEETGELSFPYRVVEQYQDGVLNFINANIIKEANFKWVLDYNSSPATNVFPSMLTKFGGNIVSLNTYVDENKLTKSHADFRNQLIQLSNITRSLKADFGVMFDAGVEKIYLVDELGNILPNEVVQAIMVYLVLMTTDKKDVKIAVPVFSSNIIDKIAERFNAKVIRTKTSHRGIMEATKNKDVLIVADTQGGFIFPEFNNFYDAMISVSKLLEMLAKVGKPLSNITFDIPPSNIMSVQVPCPFEVKGTIMRKLVEFNKDNDIELIDGIRIKEKDGWVLFLPDPDRSYFMIYTEGSNKQESRDMLVKYKDLITKWIKEET